MIILLRLELCFYRLYLEQLKSRNIWTIQGWSGVINRIKSDGQILKFEFGAKDLDEFGVEASNESGVEAPDESRVETLDESKDGNPWQV